MMECVSMVAVVRDKRGVNAASVFGSLPYCQECIRYSLDNAGQLSPKLVEELKQTSVVRLSDFQFALSDEPVNGSGLLSFTMEEFLKLSELDLCARSYSFRKLYKLYEKEVSKNVCTR